MAESSLHENTPPQGEIVIYQTEDGNTRIEVRFVDETVWLTQQQMAELFQTSRTNVVEHIRNIYSEAELEEAATCRNFRQVRDEGGRQVSRELPHYNLDMRSRNSPRSNARISKAFNPFPVSPSAKREGAETQLSEHGAWESVPPAYATESGAPRNRAAVKSPTSYCASGIGRFRAVGTDSMTCRSPSVRPLLSA